MSRAAGKEKAKAKGSAPAERPLRVAPILDDDWEPMAANFKAAKKPAKWKYQIMGESGEHFNVRHVDGRFVRSYMGDELTLVPRSVWQELREEGPRLSNAAATCPDTRDGFVRRALERRTGNHQPRNRPVRVPTAPGQPVRG